MCQARLFVRLYMGRSISRRPAAEQALRFALTTECHQEPPTVLTLTAARALRHYRPMIACKEGAHAGR